ncbi:hypothetical protein KM043_011715 [Ampulex compressa]|uniref:phospholipase A2 n=1 Tax=Ampulex compressa TaxID=860918 RepID=A0A1W6EVN9_AMPCP|nr:venom protein [Ampulex compressa]KAG7210154.1 hypothetical protein KM043_011715 [Ampulex compressa]
MFLRCDLLLIVAIFDIVNSELESIDTFGLKYGIKEYILDPRSIKEGMDPYAYSGTFLQCSDNFIEKIDRDSRKYKWLKDCCDKIGMCNDYILPRDTKYGITNNEAFKWLNCNCDYEFRTCLLEPPYEAAAVALGKSYFNIIRPKCFLKMKSGTCDNSFYDISGNPHKANPLGAYHCVTLHEQKPFFYNIKP